VLLLFRTDCRQLFHNPIVSGLPVTRTVCSRCRDLYEYRRGYRNPRRGDLGAALLRLRTRCKAASVCKLLSMRPPAKLLCLGLLISGCTLGQAAPASAPISPLAFRLDMVHRAAEQTDPTLELEQLCDEIGPRLTGSVAAQAAARQVVEYMRKTGLQKVHTEVWTLPRGWQRGPLGWSHPSGYLFRLRLTVGPDRHRRTAGQCK
jgi:hypothetical protein